MIIGWLDCVDGAIEGSSKSSWITGGDGTYDSIDWGLWLDKLVFELVGFCTDNLPRKCAGEGDSTWCGGNMESSRYGSIKEELCVFGDTYATYSELEEKVLVWFCKAVDLNKNTCGKYNSLKDRCLVMYNFPRRLKHLYPWCLSL